MLRHPWEIHLLARHRRAELAAEREQTRSLQSHPDNSAGSRSSLRRGIGLGLIAIGEWLAGREARRPVAPAPSVPVRVGW